LEAVDALEVGLEDSEEMAGFGLGLTTLSV